MDKFILFFSLTLISFSVSAENCPSVKSIQLNKASGWQAFDSDNGKPLTHAREARLRNEITQFALAEWSNTKDKSAIHCYYKDPDNSHLEAYFAKETVAAVKPSKYWYEVTGMMQCAAGADKCQFQTMPTMQHQLAQNETVSNRKS